MIDNLAQVIAGRRGQNGAQVSGAQTGLLAGAPRAQEMQPKSDAGTWSPPGPARPETRRMGLSLT